MQVFEYATRRLIKVLTVLKRSVYFAPVKDAVRTHEIAGGGLRALAEPVTATSNDDAEKDGGGSSTTGTTSTGKSKSKSQSTLESKSRSKVGAKADIDASESESSKTAVPGELRSC